MKKEVKIWLEDIKLAIDEIDGFLPKHRDFLKFKKDIKTRKAI
jgi:uncharacterized protein with HEPN domain